MKTVKSLLLLTLAVVTSSLCYAASEGVSEDKVEAFKWFRKAADQGDPQAQFNLGICYAKGEGVLQDKVEAYAYFNLAGITEATARKNCDTISKLLTASQLEAGQKRSMELQKEIDAKIAAKTAE